MFICKISIFIHFCSLPYIKLHFCNFIRTILRTGGPFYGPPEFRALLGSGAFYTDYTDDCLRSVISR